MFQRKISDCSVHRSKHLTMTKEKPTCTKRTWLQRLEMWVVRQEIVARLESRNLDDEQVDCGKSCGQPALPALSPFSGILSLLQSIEIEKQVPESAGLLSSIKIIPIEEHAGN